MRHARRSPHRYKAGHACELPFVFGRLDADDICGGYWQRFLGVADANLPELQQLSREMMASWATFVRSGTPGNIGGEPFPPFPEGRFRIDTAVSGTAPLATPELMLWAGIKQFCLKEVASLEDPYPGIVYA
jgi:carboxylesterase type B